MKRSTKNMVTAMIIIVMIGLMALTVYLGIKNAAANMQAPADMPMIGSGEASPQQPNNDQNMTNPPEKPEGGNGEAMGEPPAKPEGEQGQNMSEPPAKPDGDNSSSMPEQSQQPKGENGEAMTAPSEMPGQQGGSLPVFCYVLLGIESLIIAAAIAFLILSKGNAKDLKTAFEGSKSKIIFAVITILLTAGFTAGSILIANRFVGSGPGDPGQNMGGGKDITYSAATELTEDAQINGQQFESSKADENAVAANGKIKVTLSDITVNKTGDSDGGDNTSFYGTNSAVLARNGADLTIKNATITTDASGANGVFSYGGSATTNNTSNDGTTVTISDSTITTTKDNSGGIMTTGGGTMNASNLTINTAGRSSAAIRSDRGGGTVNVDGGSYKTTGLGSPAIYSTADITVKNAELIATVSEGAIIEGKNKITLENVKLTDTNNQLNGQSTTYKNIFIYQSMSGDAAEGNAEFTAKDSEIITNQGDSFYVTNTAATINLNNNNITNNDANGCFLRIQKDSWGKDGANGGSVIFNMNNQTADGKIVVDSISTLELNLTDGSLFTGEINSDNSAKSIALKLDKNSKIKLTCDSYVSCLEDADSSYSNIDFNGFKLYVNGTAIN